MQRHVGVAGLGVLLLIDSLLPWYRVRWEVTRYGAGPGDVREAIASAWQASSAWSVAVLLGLAAAGLGLLTAHRPARWAGATLAPAAAAVACWGWLEIPDPPHGAATYRFQADPAPRLGIIARDHLSDRDAVTAAFPVALALLLALAVLLIATAVTRRRS